MAVLERVLGVALESETPVSGLPEARFDSLTVHRQTGIDLDYVDRSMKPWFQERVGTIESEYLATPGNPGLAPVSAESRSVHGISRAALFTMMAQTGETRLPGSLSASLERRTTSRRSKILADELDETRERAR